MPRQILSSVALAALLCSACGDATDAVAGRDTVTYKSSVFAVNGSSIGSPTAINTSTATTVRAEIGYDFDIAFDIDGTGKAVVMTQRFVGAPFGTTGRPVSLQLMPGSFDAVLEAPANGWVADSMVTIGVGDVVAVRANVSACAIDFSPFMYTKLVVDSLNAATRNLWLTLVTDPNCGFRSLEPGRPTR